MVIHLFDESSNNTFWFIIISLCILAGIGADNLLFKNYKKAEGVPEDNIDDYFVPVQATEPDKFEAPIADVTEETAPVIVETPEETALETTPEMPAVNEATEEKPVESIEDKPIENAEEKTAEQTEEKREVPQFFETPLPMPKKHVKKSIDYAFEPSDDLMKYDVEISPNDDFDIK